MQTVTVIARQMRKHATELNLFVNEATRSNPFHLRTAIISTRVYIVLLIVFVTILITFTSLGTQSEVIIIRNPSQASYEALLDKNATPPSCPCSHVTISYVNFISTTLDYHPICSSMFVSDDWINHIFSNNIGSLYQADFRALASSYFQLLAAFCSHARQSIQDALNDFQLETFLTPDVLLPSSLYAQIEVKSQFLQSSTADSVRRLLQLVRTTTQANGLQATIQLSTIMFLNSFSDVFPVQGHVSFLYEDSSECICLSALNCSLPSGFFDIDRYTFTQFLSWSFTPLANVSGIFVGCSAIESLLQSTMECLFDWSCLETIHTFIPSSNIAGVYALNRNQTKFVPNTSIEIIINNLFVENWSMNASFSNYYAQCAPILCTYTIIQRNNALYVLTKLLGIYGGLTAALRLCVPLIVAWWRKRKVIVPIEARPSEY